MSSLLLCISSNESAYSPHLSVPWLFPAEINSLSMRNKGAALGTATNWIFNFMVVEITPSGIETLGWKFYIIWTVLNFSFVPTVYFFYPETADRTLEDLDRYFREHSNVFVHRDADATNGKRPLRYIEQDQIAQSSVAGDNAGVMADRKVRDEEKGERNEKIELKRLDRAGVGSSSSSSAGTAAEFKEGI